MVRSSRSPRSCAASSPNAPDRTPLEEGEVRVVGLAIWTLTDSVGRFVMRAPAGPLRIAIRRIGLKPDTAAASGDSVTIFARPLAIRLAPMGVEVEASPARAR